MRNRFVGSFIAAAAIVALAPTPAAGQPLPQSPDGKPDLSGIWQAVNSAAWNILPHAAEPDVPGGPWRRRGERHSLHAGGGGQAAGKLREPRDAGSGNEVLAAWCSTRYLHGLSLSDYSDTEPGIHPLRVRARRTEYLHELHTSGGARSSGGWAIRGERGMAITLVVDVVHFNDQTWFDKAGNHHSELLHVVERYTLMAPDHIMYEVTIEDPNVFTRSWKMSMPLYRRLDSNMQILDYECTAFDEAFRTGPASER